MIIKKYLPFFLMLLGCITWGRSGSAYFYHWHTLTLLLIAGFSYASSKTTSFQKEFKMAALLLLVIFAYGGGKTILHHISGGRTFYGILIGGVFRLAGSVILIISNLSFLKEYIGSVREKIVKSKK
jgi:hypothetical protein